MLSKAHQNATSKEPCCGNSYYVIPRQFVLKYCRMILFIQRDVIVMAMLVLHFLVTIIYLRVRYMLYFSIVFNLFYIL